MNSPTVRQWPGHLFTTYDLPGSNALAAGLSAQPITLRGTDHPSYGRAVVNAWLPRTADASTASAAAPTSADLLGVGDKIVRTAGVVLLGVVLIALGAWAIVKG